jgi:hypothetical protein
MGLMRWYLVTDYPLTGRDSVTCVRNADGRIGFAALFYDGQAIRFRAVSDLQGNVLDCEPDVRPAQEDPSPRDDNLLTDYWRD